MVEPTIPISEEFLNETVSGNGERIHFECFSTHVHGAYPSEDARERCNTLTWMTAARDALRDCLPQAISAKL